MTGNPNRSGVTENASSEQQNVATTDLEKARQLYDALISGGMSVDGVCSSSSLTEIQMKLQMTKDAQVSRTAHLWLQYMDMVDILCMFMKTERTGNWDLHLQAVHCMLPFIAAAGHNLYIYLQIYRYIYR